MAELPDSIHVEIQRLSKSGGGRASRGEYSAAITDYERALALLPEPPHDWSAFTWLKAAIADACFLDRRFEGARQALDEVLKVGPPENAENPFVQLRYGQTLLELGHDASAANWLARAFLSCGKPLFEREDPKYLQFVCSKLEPPAGYQSWNDVFDREKRRPWWRFW